MQSLEIMAKNIQRMLWFSDSELSAVSTLLHSVIETDKDTHTLNK